MRCPGKYHYGLRGGNNLRRLNAYELKEWREAIERITAQAKREKPRLTLVEKTQ